MTEDRLEQDRERASLLQELLETPVGRRWLLKAGLCSAAATAAANLPAWSAPSRVLAQAARGAGGGPATGITLQFALGPAFAGVGVQPTPSASPSASSTAEAALTPSSRPTRVARATPRAPDTPEATASAETSGTPGPADAGPQAADRLVFGAIMAAATGTPAAATATPTAKPSTPTSTPTAAATPTDTPAATATTSTTPTATATPSPSGTGTPTVSGTPSAGGISNLVLIANGGQLPLIAHTAESRAALKAQGGLWAVMDLEALTHYVTDVPLSDNRGMLVSVQATRNGAQVLVAQLWHTPPAATRGLAQLAASGPALRTLVGGDQRLRALGLSAADVAAPEHVVQLESIGDAHATAVAMCGLHPQVATVDPTSVAATKALLGQTPEVQTLGQTISTMQQQGQDIATHVQAMNRDGSPARIKVGPSASDIVGTTFTTIQLNQSNGFQAALKSGVAAGIVGVRNSADLGQVVDKPLEAYPKGTQFKTWVQPLGVTPQAKPYTPPTSAAGGVQATLKVAYVPDQVPVSNGLVFGTGTQLTGNYSNGQVQLRIYNNWVRWVWAYVQYLGKDGTNLSANASPTWPDTQYCQSLGIVPQVFTVLGVPLWDTNSVDVTLNFPKEAHTARLLYCGLGSTINGGWRQYFPADAYGGGGDKGLIAPQDEVLFPALVTGILTIGMNVFALVTDMSIAAAWQAVRTLVVPGGGPVWQALQALLQVTNALTAAEQAATAVAAGGATYIDVANGGGVKNIWNTLLAIGSVIPKVLFGPSTEVLFGPSTEAFWQKVALKILGVQIASKIINAIPFIGEVLAIIQVVGDVATLAEVAAETIVAPWVIENEVNLTYQATVTVQHDPNDATWPVTGRSWQLQAKLDDAPTPISVTGDMNVGGHTQSENLVLTVDTVPFGGSTMQWSFVVLDDSGNQVGTGVSAKLTNDDPSHPPSTVEFAITELPATISADTVFQRADTVTYSDAAGGYTWSDQVTSDGTRQSGAIQEVTGVTVSTTSGVVGVVWKQNDRYYVRGVPIAENGSTIPLSAGPKEGYARPPFLLFDAFVGREDRGNHVLLEPDDTSDAYYVRQVSLDPTTGAISWDSSTALGAFTLPVSAAALHSSGRVVALHTDSGRVGWLKPVATPRPQLAAYSAGPGSQPGLLQSPTAIAVTNPGMVLILEVGAGQLAAFDLNGNPAKYFGPNQDQYTQKLANPGTYLDLAVDGSGQIYLLYYTGDGSQPDDYRVDVYTAAGEPLATQSPGVNVAKLAVDYFRSIYAANFDPITDQGTTTPRIDPALGVAEPSISRFDPTSGGSA